MDVTFTYTEASQDGKEDEEDEDKEGDEEALKCRRQTG